MKKNGILNSEISKVLSELGHTDYICIADCGLPVPSGVKKIDLALKISVPSFIDVLKLVNDDMFVEKIILAEEIKTKNKKQLNNIKSIYKNVETEFVLHEDFKKKLKDAKAVIRTGEATPYSNIILVSKVCF